MVEREDNLHIDVSTVPGFVWQGVGYSGIPCEHGSGISGFIQCGVP